MTGFAERFGESSRRHCDRLHKKCRELNCICREAVSFPYRFRFLATSDRHSPSTLIKNQNASTINADKLNLKTSETIISNAPAAFRSEYLGDELGSLSSCRSKYAATISRTPMNPARSDKCKVISPPVLSRGGLNLAFLHIITTTVSGWGTPPLDTYLPVGHPHEIMVRLGPSIS